MIFVDFRPRRNVNASFAKEISPKVVDGLFQNNSLTFQALYFQVMKNAADRAGDVPVHRDGGLESPVVEVVLQELSDSMEHRFLA